MTCQISRRISFPTLCALSFSLLSLWSCSAVLSNGEQPVDNRLQAENSMMKKRLPLVERESEVLRKENEQNRAKIQDLEARNWNMTLELASQKEQYLHDMAAAEEEIGKLQEELQKKEKENSEKIDALTAAGKAVEAKRLQELKSLQEQIDQQKTAFQQELAQNKQASEQERQKIMEENSQRELELSTQLALLKKKLAPKEAEIASLKLAISEISIQLGAASTLSESLKKARDESLAELESVKEADRKKTEQLQVRLDALQAINAELTKKLAEQESLQPGNAPPAESVR